MVCALADGRAIPFREIGDAVIHEHLMSMRSWILNRLCLSWIGNETAQHYGMDVAWNIYIYCVVIRYIIFFLLRNDAFVAFHLSAGNVEWGEIHHAKVDVHDIKNWKMTICFALAE